MSKPKTSSRSKRSVGGRNLKDRTFVVLCVAAASLSVVVLAVLLISIATRGLYDFEQGRWVLNWTLISGVPSRVASEAGIKPAMFGTVLICFVCAVTAIPIGVGTAILLEEFKPKRRMLAKTQEFVQLNITNLAGVPSIVYGLLGLTAFASLFYMLDRQRTDPVTGEVTRDLVTHEWGVRHWDQFMTAAGTVVYVPVDSADAPPTKPSDSLNFHGASYQPIKVEVASAEELNPLRAEADAAVEGFRKVVQEGIETLPQADQASVVLLIENAWKQAGLKADVGPLKESLAQELIKASSATGRDAKKIVRRAMKPVEAAEGAARFPAVVSTDAQANRVTTGRDRPFYFRIPFGRSVLAGGLTLMLVVLPIIIISAQESLRAVPKSLRQASLAMGATPWQTIRKVTLPAATPGIMTGVILAMSRAIGEAAPILIIAGIVYITFIPKNLMDDFTAMPLQIYNWASRPQAEFYDIAAAGIILLLAILLVFNGVAIYIRQRTQQKA